VMQFLCVREPNTRTNPRTPVPPPPSPPNTNTQVLPLIKQLSSLTRLVKSIATCVLPMMQVFAQSKNVVFKRKHPKKKTHSSKTAQNVVYFRNTPSTTVCADTFDFRHSEPARSRVWGEWSGGECFMHVQRAKSHARTHTEQTTSD